jgi:hypothetical protein
MLSFLGTFGSLRVPFLCLETKGQRPVPTKNRRLSRLQFRLEFLCAGFAQLPASPALKDASREGSISFEAGRIASIAKLPELFGFGPEQSRQFGDVARHAPRFIHR